MDPTFQRRLKAIAALKGVSMRGYCQAAIDRELTRDEANGMAGLLSDKPDHEVFAELRQEIFEGKPLPGSSADLIREAREIRDAETEALKVSMRGYCQAAIDRELTRDEANGMAGLLSDKPDHEVFAELRQEIFEGKPLPGSSADLIREAREIRDAETEGWA